MSADDDEGGGDESMGLGFPAAPRPALMDITARGNRAMLNAQGLGYGGAFRPHHVDQGNWSMPGNLGFMPDNLGLMPDDLGFMPSDPGDFWARMHTTSP